ncbi:Hypothetical protein F387_01900 [Wohlfahrtiimonas chitiniclastica SH04]|uniref:Salt-induced outer membrane protein n=1 Tax=Wohlfahrtiimonas chitiniclastica SH04 TaxID=1261130 RepID=L8XYF2_9GAMM|nr:Hypothetical protein F387_01900 [Wohlfahrtiimonas chitiniclastica SH04]
MSVKKIGWSVGLLLLSSVFADEVALKNGDRLSGQITYLEGPYLFLKTDYAGTVKIDQSQVVSFTTTNAVNVKRDLFSSEIVGHGAEFKIVKKEGKRAQRLLLVDTDDGVVQMPMSEQISLAKINEKMPKRQDLKVTGNVTFGAYIDRDSTKTARYNWANTIKIEHGLWRHTLNGAFYRKTESDRTKSYYYNLGYSVDRFFSPHFFWQSAMSYQHDWIEEIRENTMVGTGPGWQLWNNERSAFSVATLLNYQVLEYRNDDHRENPQASLKWDYRQALMNQSIKFSTTGEVGRSFNQAVTLDLNLGATLSYQLTDAISVNTGVSYEKIRSKDGESRNRSVHFGLGYHW